MSLIGKLLGTLLTTGSITLVQPGGRAKVVLGS